MCNEKIMLLLFIQQWSPQFIFTGKLYFQFLNTVQHILSASIRKCINIGRPVVITFLKAEAGAISAPLSVRRRNIGHEEAFILKPVYKVKTVQFVLK